MKAKIHSVLELLRHNKYVEMFLDDISFRSSALLYQGLFINLIYAVFRQVTAFTHASVWYGAIAVYFSFSCLTKVFLLYRASKLKKIKLQHDRLLYEYKSYRLCGGMILLMNSGMAGIIVMIVRQNQHYSYPGYLVILSAAYTFYMVISSVINIFKFRKLNSPMLSSSKAVTFVSALMSLMVLQTALISQFGEENVAFRQTANTLTGTAVCLLSLGLAVYMIIRASIKIRELNTVSKNAYPE